MHTLIKVMTALFLIIMAGYGCGDGGNFMFGEINKEKSEETRRLIRNELGTSSMSL